MIEKLRGIRTPAWLTALIRGSVEAALFGFSAALIDALTSADVPVEYRLYGGFAVLVLRQAEGVLDQIDPIKQRRRVAADEVS